MKKSFLEYLLESNNVKLLENAGHEFENNFFNALQDVVRLEETDSLSLVNEKENYELYKERAKDVLEKFILKRPLRQSDKLKFTFNKVGELNNARNVLEKSNDVVKPIPLNDQQLNIGKTVSDITIVYNDTNEYYLSLKSTGTVTFINTGLTKFNIFNDRKNLENFFNTLFTDVDKVQQAVDSIFSGLDKYELNQYENFNTQYKKCTRDFLKDVKNGKIQVPKGMLSNNDPNVFVDMLAQMIEQRSESINKINEIFIPAMKFIDASFEKAIIDPSRGVVGTWMMTVDRKKFRKTFKRKEIHGFQKKIHFESTIQNGILKPISYNASNTMKILDSIDLTIDQKNFAQLIKNSIGYGFIYVHLIRKDIHLIDMRNIVILEKIVDDIISRNKVVTMRLPNESSKAIEIRLDSSYISNLKLTFRDKKGSIIPTSLLLQYREINRDPNY